MKKILLGVALSALAFSAQAQDTRYSTWSDPSKPTVQSNQQMDRLLDELRTLVTKAKDARAADPKFLRDLEDLAAKYDMAPAAVQRLIFSDDFADGDYTRNPVWKVTSGKYWVERGYGLRSFVEATTTTTQAQPQQKKLSKEEAIIGILGAVLGGKVQQQSQQQPAQTTTKVTPAVIHVAKQINNAFSLKIDLSSWKESGHLELGTYQGTNLNTGYKLVYQSGKTPALQLVRNYTKSATVVGKANSLKLEDQKNHVLEWTRTTSGQMTVSVDGKRLIQATDTGFRDDFAGFVMSNQGGDYIVKSIEVSGTR